MAGISSIVLFLVGFGYWSNTALIAGAVITSGAFVTTGQNKIIQHLEGGVIRDAHLAWQRFGPVIEKEASACTLAGTPPSIRPTHESEVARLRGAAALVFQRRAPRELTTLKNSH